MATRRPPAYHRSALWKLYDGVAGQLGLTQSGTGTTILANAFNSYSEATTVSKGTDRKSVV